MKAIFKEENDSYRSKNIYFNQKEMIEVFIGADGKEQVVELIIYQSKNHSPHSSKKIYASVKVDYQNKKVRTGIGSTGGNNYHKASAAAYEAFKSAGIEFDENIDAVGTRAMEKAVLSVLEYYGCSNPNVYRVANI